jgi:Mg2+ and Co2+ transporter CorA
MLKVYRDNEGAFPSSQLEGLPSQIIWIDPTDAEKKIVEERVGIQIPSVAALSEIETSSRLVVDWEVMYLSTPVVAQADSADAFLSPVGFVVTKRVLVTVRFAELTAFNFVAERIARDQSLARIAPFVLSIRHDWIVPEFEARLTAVGKDVTSLNDYEGQLSNKVQSLLDAVLGFISIEQNDLFKVLTIVSVVGIPPTIVVGIYGMNFRLCPS